MYYRALHRVRRWVVIYQSSRRSAWPFRATTFGLRLFCSREVRSNPARHNRVAEASPTKLRRRVHNLVCWHVPEAFPTMTSPRERAGATGAAVVAMTLGCPAPRPAAHSAGPQRSDRRSDHHADKTVATALPRRSPRLRSWLARAVTPVSPPSPSSTNGGTAPLVPPHHRSGDFVAQARAERRRKRRSRSSLFAIAATSSIGGHGHWPLVTAGHRTTATATLASHCAAALGRPAAPPSTDAVVCDP